LNSIQHVKLVLPYQASRGFNQLILRRNNPEIIVILEEFLLNPFSVFNVEGFFAEAPCPVSLKMKTVFLTRVQWRTALVPSQGWHKGGHYA
jgi:hypothetical protein